MLEAVVGLKTKLVVDAWKMIDDAKVSVLPVVVPIGEIEFGAALVEAGATLLVMCAPDVTSVIVSCDAEVAAAVGSVTELKVAGSLDAPADADVDGTAEPVADADAADADTI